MVLECPPPALGSGISTTHTWFWNAHHPHLVLEYPPPTLGSGMLHSLFTDLPPMLGYDINKSANNILL